jgi:predicted dehydrogenase
MRFGDERIASFTCSFGAADRSTYSIAGTRGGITLEPAYEYAQGLAYKMKVKDRTTTKALGKSDQFAPELIYFSDCILQNRQPQPSGAEGLADVRVIEAMLRSIKSGRWVHVERAKAPKRPSMRQQIRRPAVPREPPLLNVKPPSQ